MPPTASPKKEAILAIGLNKPTAEIQAKAAAKGVTVSRAYIELLKKGRSSGNPKASPAKTSTAQGRKAAAPKGAGAKAAASQEPAQSPVAGKGAAMSKSAFIRSRPDLGPTALVAEAKKLGMTFSPQYVSAIRTGDKVRGKRVGRAAPKETREPSSVPVARTSATASAPRAGAHGAAGGSPDMNAFLMAALAIGLDRALDVLQGLKRTIESQVG